MTFANFKSKFKRNSAAPKKEKKNSKMFATMQRFGGSLMVAVALLPAAGILLGIGTAFTNTEFIDSNGLSSSLGIGTIGYQIFNSMKCIGKVVFDILPFLFAIGVAIGMSNDRKHIAAFTAGAGYLIFVGVISALLYTQQINPKTTSFDYLTNYENLSKGEASAIMGKYTSIMGIFTLNMGIFGGIIVGLLAAKLNNMSVKLYDKGSENKILNNARNYVSWNNLYVISSMITLFAFGVIAWLVWPLIQTLISWIGIGVSKSGYFGTFMYGVIERALVPFGLHHVFYLPFWQSEVGGVAMVGGQLVQGAQNIFFNEMFVGDLDHFNVNEGTRFMAGKYPFMMFGLPAAAAGMVCALPKENRKAYSAIYISAGLTSFLTGITEPIEYTFLFVAPVLFYGVHVFLAGFSFLMMHVLNVGVGMTFSGGAIDFTLFGLMQGADKTSWYWIPVVGAAIAPVYFFVWRWYILKHQSPIPGMTVSTSNSIASTVEEKEDIYSSNLVLAGKHSIANNLNESLALKTKPKVEDTSRTTVKKEPKANSKKGVK